MGSSLEDILIEVENGNNETGYKKVKRVWTMRTQSKTTMNIEEYVQTVDNEGVFVNLHIDCGDNGNGLQYLGESS